MATSYTAIVTATGEGRNGGRATADDGLLDVDLAIPKALGGAGGATNPEQLFAAGWAACFMGAIRRAAAERRTRLDGLTVAAEITLHHGDDGEFGLSAVLRVELGGVDQDTAGELGAAAHQICPYSKATRGNIPVVIDATAVA
ncbi:Ohr family peroxiredoxin [Actinoallomurus iriomotensis]|uniref:Osmotically inducible protein C n=1 Tax=Actinoallomurus iriomotensis TaxID=478107 RepID=A0A9W6S0S9_9ACTN|nr:Ohr family peroxiredoxin [Actinoallomurus iriomotensis]GLY85201.1 osmotically inducible protein C [Actinoallomurus iriomotensis]